MCNEVSSLIIKQDPKTSGKYFCFQKAPFELENSSRKQMLLKFLNYGKKYFCFLILHFPTETPGMFMKVRPSSGKPRLTRFLLGFVSCLRSLRGRGSRPFTFGKSISTRPGHVPTF